MPHNALLRTPFATRVCNLLFCLGISFVRARFDRPGREIARVKSAHQLWTGNRNNRWNANILSLGDRLIGLVPLRGLPSGSDSSASRSPREGSHPRSEKIRVAQKRGVLKERRRKKRGVDSDRAP